MSVERTADEFAGRRGGGRGVSEQRERRPSDPADRGERTRVVVVGRTGLDAELRRDPRFELLRPRSVTDAIGELAESVGPDDADAQRGTLVLLAPDAVSPDRSAAFAAAVRRIAPAARVLEVTAVAGRLGGVDGVIAPAAGVAGVVAAAARLSVGVGAPALDAQARTNIDDRSDPYAVPNGTPPTPTRAGHAGSAPVAAGLGGIAGPLFPEVPVRLEVVTRTPTSVMPVTTVATSEVGESRLTSTPRETRETGATSAPASPMSAASAPAEAGVNVHERTPLGAMLAGRDPVAAALASITALRGQAVRYVPAAEAEAGHRSVHGMAPVAYGGRVYGYLGVEGALPAWLTQDASWLAGWAALAVQHERLRAEAFCDELTGAWNRRYFSRFLASAITQSRAMRRPVSLLVFDIDNFKSFNDRYGHAAGDDILIETVRLLKTIVRPSDRVCRVGGDEFAVIFHDPEGPRNPGSPESAAGLQSVADIARRFQKQLCEHRFPKLADQAPGSCSISGGMATFPWDGQTPEELLERADALALQSKRQGKNAITLGPGAERACEVPE